jgi:hypothetical protein
MGQPGTFLPEFGAANFVAATKDLLLKPKLATIFFMALCLEGPSSRLATIFEGDRHMFKLISN